ncbi:MAG: hypothetical protein KJ899_04765 [Gammaproteobacteria bacterium]|nr:hypothetical protein [Gammaproteobacteria bacterium]
MNIRKLLLSSVVAIVFTVSLNACGKKLPDPVERKDGYAWIPIADTAFLIPEKTWLKSYGRKATDGSVASFHLHATAPDVQPWSQAVNEQMYPALGPGKRVDVDVRDISGELLFNQYEDFFKLPRYWGGELLEEGPADIEINGLRRFRAQHSSDTAFYLRIEKQRIRYFIRCDEDKNPPHRQFCHLRFPWSRALYVDLVFTRNYLPSSIQMAERITAKLKEFESAGQAYLHNQPFNQN